MSTIMEEMCSETAENTILQAIRNLMDTMDWTAERAMAAIKVPISEREKYKEKL